jgi:hypothetical protein
MVLFEEIQTNLDNFFSSNLFVNEKENSKKVQTHNLCNPLDCKEILTTTLISFFKNNVNIFFPSINHCLGIINLKFLIFFPYRPCIVSYYNYVKPYCTLNSLLLCNVCPCVAIDNIGMSKLSELTNVVWVFDVVDQCCLGIWCCGLIPSCGYLKV